MSKKDLKFIEDMTLDDIKELPDAPDGKAEWLGEGTEDEFKEQENEKKGLKGIFGLK